MKQNRFKSWALWLSLAALIVFVVKTFFQQDISEEVDGIMNAALPVLIGFGLINNPTDKENY